jgi:seryl-tRNA(Sec) selenium transferase
LADVVARSATVPTPNLAALRSAVAAYVQEARAADLPAARVVIAVKAVCRDQARELDPVRYQALLDGVVSWAVTAYYGPA